MSSSKRIQVVCGPLLRYIEIDYSRRNWRGSCLIVANSTQAPSLNLIMQSNQTKRLVKPTEVEVIDAFRNEYFFWRYELVLPMSNSPQTVIYNSDCLDREFEFHIPAIQDSMRFMFYSCNGFSDVPEEIKLKFNENDAPLWQDMLDRHAVMPLHILLGGGDQLYQDSLIHEDFMKPWVAEKDPNKRLAMKLPQSMKGGFEHFYFWNYIKNFGFEGSPVQAQAFATIPSVNMWDDHDIIDGYGSYPDDLQSADCFQVLFANATRFYYTFQLHTTIRRADGLIRGKMPTCNHIITTLGPDIGLLSVDARGERTKLRICSAESYDVIFREIHQRIPSTVKHLVVVTGVPVIYPRLTLFEKAMDSLSHLDLATITGRMGTFGNIIGEQLNVWNGDPELLDDMNDHWTATHHEVERRNFIESLQAFAKDRSIRVSFIGGDVHCCSSGRLYSKNMLNKEEYDPFLMVQVISSAIVNVPPPQILPTIINEISTHIAFDNNVEEKMYELFKFSPDGRTRQNKKLMAMRNYCVGYFNESSGDMHFWIQVEQSVGEKGTKGYLLNVPRLIFGAVGVDLYSRQRKQFLFCPLPVESKAEEKDQAKRRDYKYYKLRLQKKIAKMSIKSSLFSL